MAKHGRSMEVPGVVGVGNRVDRTVEESKAPAELPSVPPVGGVCEKAQFEGRFHHLVKAGTRSYSVTFEKDSGYRFSTTNAELAAEMDKRGFKRVKE
jgi:hypothetical protein